MNKYISDLKDLVFSKTAKDATVVFIGNATSSLLAIVFTIFAARSLGPENWGMVAAVTSLVAILVAFGELGLDAGLLKFVSKLWRENKFKEAKSIFQTVFTVRLMLAATIIAILFLAPQEISKLAFNSKDTSLVYFSALGFLAALIFDYQIAATQSKEHWIVAAFLLTLTNIIRILGLLFLIWTDSVNLASVLKVFTGSGFICFLLSLYWHQTPLGFSKNWQEILRQIIPFSGWMGLNKIVSVLNGRIDVLLLLSLSSAYSAGVYAAANRLAMGVPIIVASFATVLAPKLAGFNTKEELEIYFKKSLGLTLLISIGLLFGVLVSPFVIKLFGPEYKEAGPILQLLFISYIPFTLSTPAVNTLIYSFKRPQIIAIMTIIQSPLVIAANYFLIPRFDIYAPVVIIAGTNTISMFVSYYFVWRYLSKKEEGLQ